MTRVLWEPEHLDVIADDALPVVRLQENSQVKNWL